MAVTEIHPITTSLNKALDYIENPDKTEEKMLCTGYACIPDILLVVNLKKSDSITTKGRLSCVSLNTVLCTRRNRQKILLIRLELSLPTSC